MTTFTKRLAAAILAAGGLGGLAHAGDSGTTPTYTYKKVIEYQTVTEWVTKRVPYTATVTKYDHCDKPYTVQVTKYRDVQVAVTKKVPVAKYVKVPAY